MSVSSQTRGSIVEQLVFCEHRIRELEDQNNELLEACEAAISMGDTREVRQKLSAAYRKARGEEG